MKRLITALGVDHAQWKALTIALLKLDFRMRNFGRTGRSGRGTRQVVGQLVFYIFVGALMGAAVHFITDRFLAGLIVTGYVMFMVGTAVLLEHGSAVVSPTDYAVLGFRPITSRTYFATRLTNVLVYTMGMTAAVGLIPVIVTFVDHGPAVGVAALAAVGASGLTVTLAVVVGYAALARFVGPKRLRNLLSYVQLAVGFLVYGGYFIVAEFTSQSALANLSLPRSPWLLAYPGTWFASYLEIAAGRLGMIEVLGVLLSLAAMAGLALGLRGRLTLEYAERLGALASSGSARRTPKTGTAWWFRGGEARAVAILVRSQFRNDMKFRMGVLAILPLTLVYLVGGLRDTGAAGRGGNLSMVSIAVLMFPTMLKMNLSRSDAFRASWIFFATPADRIRLVRSSKNVLVAFFLLPYLAFVGVTLVFIVDDLAFLAVYLLFTGLLSHLVLLVVTILEPELPFSKPATKGSSTFVYVAMMVMAVAAAVMQVLSRWVYGDATTSLIVFAAVIALSLVISRLTRVRVERQAARLEFEG